jgi:GNAT superfamily N-acetyltransferase
MTIRHGTDDDRATLRSLWELWQSEGVAPPWADTSWEANEPELDRALAANGLFLAEENGDAIGFVSSWLENNVARIGDLYVTKAARGTGAGRALVEAVIENLRARGATHLRLDANLEALAFYERLGFREESRNLVLELEIRQVGRGRSYGAIHVQTDDLAAVERAVRQFVPRLPGQSQGSLIAPPRGGWIAVYDDVCDRDPAMLRRLAKELSERLGAVVLSLGVEHEEVVRFVLLEAGRVVDEYLRFPSITGRCRRVT